MLERIVGKSNMLMAYTQVVGNKGCAGVDNMGVQELESYLKSNWAETKQAILEGSYRPKLVLGVELDKPKGGKRLLGIPTVMDRLIQQAIQQELSQHFDPIFSQFSYGFRKGKSAHQAIKQALAYANTSLRYVVDIDLSKFFDRVNHDYLMGLLSKEIHDKRLLSLIRRYLHTIRYPFGWIDKQTNRRDTARKSFKSIAVKHHSQRT